MSALTDRRKREIEMLYRKMKEEPSKVFLNVFIDDVVLNEDPTLPAYVYELFKQMGGLKSYNYTEGSNHITATVLWTESEAKYRVEDLRNTRGIKNVQAWILYPTRD